METTTDNEALIAAIRESGLRKGFIAGQLGIAAFTLSRWIKGKYVPGREHREALARVLRREDPSGDEFVPSLRVQDAPHTDEGIAA